MSTQAVFTFKDNGESFHVFKHYDGYPSNAIQCIVNALPKAWPLPRFEPDDFAAAFVAANKPNGGGDVRLVKSATYYTPSYSYVVEYKEGNLHVSVFEYSDHAKRVRIFSGTLTAALDWTTLESVD